MWDDQANEKPWIAYIAGGSRGSAVINEMLHAYPWDGGNKWWNLGGMSNLAMIIIAALLLMFIIVLIVFLVSKFRKPKSTAPGEENADVN